ncbi:hypothetical protein L209DRAFT_758142 [Thermothelomyces heterothallicus CBS 203.75]
MSFPFSSSSFSSSSHASASPRSSSEQPGACSPTRRSFGARKASTCVQTSTEASSLPRLDLSVAH